MHPNQSFSLSAPWGGEGRGEVGAIASDGGRPPHPPALRAGPSLSPLKGGEGHLTGIARRVQTFALSWG